MKPIVESEASLLAAAIFCGGKKVAVQSLRMGMRDQKCQCFGAYLATYSYEGSRILPFMSDEFLKSPFNRFCCQMPLEREKLL